jgi:hypothetical protein
MTLSFPQNKNELKKVLVLGSNTRLEIINSFPHIYYFPPGDIMFSRMKEEDSKRPYTLIALASESF